MIQPRPIGEIVHGESFELTQPGELRVPGVGTFLFSVGWWFESSIPRALWTATGYSPNHEHVLWAGCCHDAAYCLRLFSRQKCDALFRTICLMDDVPSWKANVMYYALRLFGGVAWRKISDEDRDEARRLTAFMPD